MVMLILAVILAALSCQAATADTVACPAAPVSNITAAPWLEEGNAAYEVYSLPECEARRAKISLCVTSPRR
jgi:hypothetical protein